MLALCFLLLTTCCWFINELDVAKKVTKNQNVSKKAKQNNFYLALVTIFCFVTLYISFFSRWEKGNIYFVYVGLLITLAGIFMRRVAINTLNKNFDGLIQIKEGQRLIQHGMYKYFRHPSYTATMLLFFGFGVASMNMWNAIVFPLLFFICYHFRIQYEEQVLIKGFGEEYMLYRQRTWGMLPWFKTKSKKQKEVHF